MDPRCSDITDAGPKNAPGKNAKSADANAIQLAMLQTFIAVIVFIPFADRSWCPFAAAITGYSVLVFSLAFRDHQCSLRKHEVRLKLPGILLLHVPFIAAVYLIVTLSIRFAPQLPTFLTQASRKGSLLDWIVTFALVMLAWAQEHSIRAGIRRDLRLHQEDTSGDAVQDRH